MPHWLQVNGLLMVHLPDGPTARFRLRNLVLGGWCSRRARLSCALCICSSACLLTQRHDTVFSQPGAVAVFSSLDVGRVGGRGAGRGSTVGDSTAAITRLTSPHAGTPPHGRSCVCQLCARLRPGWPTPIRDFGGHCTRLPMTLSSPQAGTSRTTAAPARTGRSWC